MADVTAREYEIVIEPAGRSLNVDWRELWEYRDLLVLLIARDLTSRYKQTLLGPVWFIVQPVLTTFVLLAFGHIAEIPTDGIPGPLFYLCGLLGWNYFAQNITNAGATFINNAHIFGKVFFPRLVVPLAIVVSNLVSLALQAVPFLAFLAYYELIAGDVGAVQLTWRILLVPLPIVHLAVLSLGVSLWMSASTAKYRDLVHLNQYLIQIWMLATPIIYPLSKMIAKVPPHLEWLVWINPVAVPTESLRLCLLGRGTLSAGGIFASVFIALLLLVTGVAVFQRVERTVVDSV